MRRTRPARLRPVFVAPLLIVIALVAWMLASPIGSSPDDNFHLPSAWCGIGERAGICEPGSSPAARDVPKGVADASDCYRERPSVAANCQGNILSNPEMVSTDRVNTTGLYPPVFYGVMSLFASPLVVTSALLMRLANIIIFVLVLCLVYVNLPVLRRPSLAVGALITMVPLGCFLVASDNPSSWAVISAFTVWISVEGALESTGRRRWSLAGLALVGTLLGAGARADSAVFTVIAAAAAVFLAARRGADFRRALVIPGVVVVASIIMFFMASQVASAGTGGLAMPGQDGGFTGFPLLVSNFLQVPGLWAGVFGTWDLGWFDTAMPAMVWIAGATAYVFTVTLLLRGASRRKVVVLVALLTALTIMPLCLLQTAGREVGTAVQPRYLLPLVIIATCIALWRDDIRNGLTRVQAALCVGAVTLANAVALYFNMLRYVSGGTSMNLANHILWWWQMPLGPMVVWAVGAVAFGGAAYLIVWHSLNLGKNPRSLDTRSVRLSDVTVG